MKNVFKLSFAALTLSLVMMLSPTQINATYMSSIFTDVCESGESKCTCSNGCIAGWCM